MSLYCLDSMYYIWGVLSRSSPGRADKIPQARNFFHQLDEEDATILVPTPLVTELLMSTEPSEREAVISILEGRFFVAEFDLPSAKLAADIWNAKKRSGVIGEIQRSGTSLRTKMKVDVQILAIAINHNVDVLFTSDEGLKKLAEGYLITRDMPEFQSQMEIEFPPSPDGS